MKTAWVVPCLYDPIVHDCVDAIHKHYPDDQVIVVDACSPDTSYLDELDATIHTGNKHFGTGAWHHALDTDADFFCLIQDSVVPLEPYRFDGLQALRWFDEVHGHDAQKAAYIFQQCDRLGIYAYPDDVFFGVFGPILFTPRSQLEQLENMGVLDCKPTSKLEESAMERIVGLAFMDLAVDFIANPIEGRHTHPDDSFPDSPFHKHMLNRGE